MSIIQYYENACNVKSDINEHLPTLKRYASKCGHVTEMGVRSVVSTWALLAGNPKRMVSYDIKYHPNIDLAISEASGIVDFEFKKEDVLKTEIEETDLLFIDTWHIFDQLSRELHLHASKVRKYIILHDTNTFWIRGENKKEGMKRAVEEFLLNHPEWKIKEVFENNNGLMIIDRI